jgi:hypothetical protein
LSYFEEDEEGIEPIFEEDDEEDVVDSIDDFLL